MAATDLAGLRQRPLAAGDVVPAMALVAEAGWNQVADDWALMQRMGDAVGLFAEDGALMATALALPYPVPAGDRPFGWISMVLVAGAMRRRGLATHLLLDRIRWLRERDMLPILDATEAGEKVYVPLGFGPGIRISRWQGQGGQDGQAATASADLVRPMMRVDRPAMAALDAGHFGADRRALIDAFLDRPGSLAMVAGRGEEGFGILRHGRRAAQIGPLLAGDEGMAIALLDALLAATPGPVFLDVLDARQTLVEHLRRRGFTRQRGYLRMALADPDRGEAMPDFDRGGRSMVIAGPEYG